MRRLAVILAAALTGCASAPPIMWVKEGATQQDFEQARAQCIYEVASSTQYTDPAHFSIWDQELERSIRQKQLAQLCMQAKGFRPQPVDGSTAAAHAVNPQIRDDCRWVAADEFRCGK
jgi:hypothetical protein